LADWLNNIPKDKRKEIKDEYENSSFKNKIDILKKWHPKGYITIEPIKTLGEFFKYIRVTTTKSTWFRGESKDHKFLIPKLYRNINKENITEQLKKEKRYLYEFRRRAHSLVGEIETDNIWMWYFLIQHYGGPTRLLDWSKDAAVALFFALNSDLDDNPIIIILQPTTLIDYAYNDIECEIKGESTVLYPGEFPTNKWINNLDSSDYNIPNSPIPLLPPYSDKRISAQNSCFTLFGKRINGFYKDNKQIVCPCCERKAIYKLVIDKGVKEELIEELSKMGVTYSKIYPGLEGLNKELTNEIYST
jgi:hypothetical protein